MALKLGIQLLLLHVLCVRVNVCEIWNGTQQWPLTMYRTVRKRESAYGAKTDVTPSFKLKCTVHIIYIVFYINILFGIYTHFIARTVENNKRTKEDLLQHFFRIRPFFFAHCNFIWTKCEICLICFSISMVYIDGSLICWENAREIVCVCFFLEREVEIYLSSVISYY